MVTDGKATTKSAGHLRPNTEPARCEQSAQPQVLVNAIGTLAWKQITQAGVFCLSTGGLTPS
jgi:hypothetical protein